MENVGSLIISGVKGTSLLPEEKEAIQSEKIGGIILFTHNYEDPAQLAELVNSIQQLRDEYPLFISVDHEGGRVIRFKKHFTQFPSMYDLARLDSPKLVYEAHLVMAKELKACGVNLSFSPVCDIWTNPENKVIGDRSFGKDIETVDKFSSAAIRGLQTHGVLACAKHFPGHGNTLKDSHYDLPLIKDSLEDLKQREIQTFIKASKSRVEMMMMAHLMVDAIDDKFPTSVSHKAYDLLRQETKFSKIVITDDMEMKAIADRYSIEEAAFLAIDAGADIVLYRFLDDAVRAAHSLRDCLKTKRLKKEKFLMKEERILKCKKTWFGNYSPIYIPKITESFNSQEAKNILLTYQNFINEQNSQK